MSLARTSPSNAELWRRVVFWTRASENMIAGCGIGCLLAFVAFALSIALGAHAAHVLAAGAALGVVLEAVRRVCEVCRRRALDTAAPSFLESHGLSRDALALAASTLQSGRIEELDASLAFERDPFHCAIESVFGRPGASAAPLCEQAEGARTVVVALGGRWAAVLRFTNDELREARGYERRFAWNDGAGPRQLDLPIDGDARALLERSIEALAHGPLTPEHLTPNPAASPHVRVEGPLAIGIAVIDAAGRWGSTTGAIDVTGEVRKPADGDRGGPYRAITRPADTTRSDVTEVLIAGRRLPLATSPHDESAPSLFAHIVVHAAARPLSPLVLVDEQIAVKGRPLRIDGVPLVAGVHRESRWIDAIPTIPEPDPARRARLADLWLRAALDEHASIFAFERLAHILSTLGAPAPLIDRAHSAAAEETRHARDAFSLAAAYSGEPLGPAPLQIPDAPHPSIDALALETFFDGCIGETLAARQAAASLARCRVPAARAALDRIAVDERRHADLAWDMLAWLWPRTSAPARARIAAASPPAPLSDRDPDRRDDWLAPHGWLTPDEERALAIAAWRDEISPRRDALLRDSTAPRAPGSRQHPRSVGLRAS